CDALMSTDEAGVRILEWLRLQGVPYPDGAWMNEQRIPLSPPVINWLAQHWGWRITAEYIHDVLGSASMNVLRWLYAQYGHLFKDLRNVLLPDILGETLLQRTADDMKWLASLVTLQSETFS